MLSRTKLLVPMAAAATISASLLLAAGPPAHAAGICTTVPSVTYSQSENSTSATSKAVLNSNPCGDGVEAAVEVFFRPTESDVYGYGNDVKIDGSTSTKTAIGQEIKYGFRYFANKKGTAKWYYVWQPAPVSA